MLIGNIFNRILSEWSLLIKEIKNNERSLARKIPIHPLFDNIDIEFLVILDESNDNDPDERSYYYVVELVMFEVNIQGNNQIIYDGLDVSISRRDSNSHLIKFTAVSDKNAQFSLFISYLIHYLKGNDFNDALKDALKDLKSYWSSYSFSREKQLGLFGELYILDKVAELIGWEKALTCWEGPDSALRDFSFNNSFVEVKTTLTDPPKIRIENPEQLFPPITKSLFVNVCIASTGKGMDLDGKINELNEKYGEAAKNIFNSKLNNVGYFDNILTTKLLKITINESLYFCVDDSQMVLSKEHLQDLPESVTDIKYNLDIASFVKHKTNVSYWIKNE
jgi:hypothetical protein